MGPPPTTPTAFAMPLLLPAQALDANNTDGAAEAFIDFWMGTGAWKNTPDARKPAIAASMVNVRRWAHALTTEPTPLSAFRSFDVPVLYMTGKRSPQSALGVARRLIPTLPRVEAVEFDKCGHMGPLHAPGPHQSGDPGLSGAAVRGLVPSRMSLARSGFCRHQLGRLGLPPA